MFLTLAIQFIGFKIIKTLLKSATMSRVDWRRGYTTKSEPHPYGIEGDNLMSSDKKSNEIHLTRVYNASAQAIWEAWTDPAQAAHWWGPRGFTITTHSKDFKVGGIWHYTMHGPNGADYVNKAKYIEIEKFKKMIYDQGGNDVNLPLFRVSVDFTESAGKTTMQMCMTFPTSEAAETSRAFIQKVGGEATWDRLAEYLEKKQLSR